jgi:hypothetical protein
MIDCGMDAESELLLFVVFVFTAALNSAAKEALMENAAKKLENI